MTRTGRREQPADIAALRERIERWRRTRKGGDAMPPELWAAATALARGPHTLTQVSRGLAVDYGSLKRRVDEAEAAGDDVGITTVRPGREVTDDEDALRFIELDGPSLFGQASVSERVVELVASDGGRMTIRQPAGAELDVVGLAASFWRRGR